MAFRIFVLLCFFSTFAQSQPAGSPDTTFGTNGISGHTLTINSLLHGIVVHDFHILPGGKMIAVGIAQNGCSSTQNQFGIIFRLNSDGDLDITFDNVGYRLFANYYFQAIIPYDANTFYVVSTNDLLKVDADGEPDVNFGTNGFLPLDVEAYKGLLSPDGKIVLGGRKMNLSANWEMAAKRLNSNGTTDASFGVNGVFTVPHVSGAGTAFGGMHIDSQNRLLLVGRRQVSQNNGKIIAFRLLSDGTTDLSFANAGEYFENAHYTAHARNITTTANGNIVIAGNGKTGSWDPHGLILIQLDDNGILDTGFATAGMGHFPIYGETTAYGLHIMNDGSIVATGGYESTYIAKFDAQGSPETGFGTNGVVNESLFAWTGYNTGSKTFGNRIVLTANTAFADCAQQKYEALFARHFLDDQGLTVTAFPANNLVACDTSSNGGMTGEFNLTDNNAPIIYGQNGVTVTYHLSLADAQNGTGVIPNPSSYTNISNPQTLYARIHDGTGDFDTTTFELTVNPLPVVPTGINPILVCTPNPYFDFDLTIREDVIYGTQPISDFDIHYFTTLADAQNNTNAILFPDAYSNQTNPETIYVRLEDVQTGCFAIATFELIVAQLYMDQPPGDIYIDEGDGDGQAEFDLTVNQSQMLGTQDATTIGFVYFETLADAEENTGAIANPEAYVNTNNPQTVFVRMNQNQASDCFLIESFDIETDFFINTHTPGQIWMEIYPNPVNSTLTVNAQDAIENIQVFTLRGQEVPIPEITNGSRQKSLYFQGFATGVYLVRVATKTGISISQVIKQ